MHEVIQKVIAAEARAKQAEQAARAEAGRMIAEAQKRAQELTASARQEAHSQAQEFLAAAATRSEAARQTRLAAAIAEIEQKIQLDETARRQAVAAVVRSICG